MKQTSGSETQLTTLKLKPRIGGGLRIMAALDGVSVAELAEQAVREILDAHGRTSATLPPKVRTGRPGPTVQQAAQAVMKLKPTRNDAIPTRMDVTTHRELEDLAMELGTRMGHLAEEGAIRLLKRSGAKIVKDVAGLASDTAYESAMEKIRGVAEGSISPLRLQRKSRTTEAQNTTKASQTEIAELLEEDKAKTAKPRRGDTKAAAATKPATRKADTARRTKVGAQAAKAAPAPAKSRAVKATSKVATAKPVRDRKPAKSNGKAALQP